MCDLDVCKNLVWLPVMLRGSHAGSAAYMTRDVTVTVILHFSTSYSTMVEYSPE